MDEDDERFGWIPAPRQGGREALIPMPRAVSAWELLPDVDPPAGTTLP